MRRNLGKSDYCKKGLIAIVHYEKLHTALCEKLEAEGSPRRALEEAEWVPMSLEAKQVARTSPMLKLSRKELEALATAAKNTAVVGIGPIVIGSVTWELYSQFSRGSIDNDRYC
jgi:hypothetical protein